MQLENDGDFFYFLADAAVMAVGVVSFTAILHFQFLQIFLCFIFHSFNMEIPMNYAPLLFKQRRLETIWWYAPFSCCQSGSFIWGHSLKHQWFSCFPDNLLATFAYKWILLAY